MADTFLFVQTQPTSIAGSGAAAGATSVVLSSFKTIDGTNLLMTDFGTIGFGTLEPGNSTQEEQISWTGITQNSNGTATLTGVKTVLFVAPYTQTSGLAKTHPGSSKFVVSNTAGFYDKLTSKADDETITGKWTFPNDPNRPAIVADTDTAEAAALVTFGQLSRQAIAGAANASTIVKGLVQLPHQSDVDNKSTTGSTGALFAVTPDKLRATKYNDYAVDTGTRTQYAVAVSPLITQYVAGIELRFKASHSNVGVASISVCGLAAKGIKREGGSIDLGFGDITTNAIVGVVFDGSYFQMIAPTPMPTGSITMFAASTAPAGWLLCNGGSYSRTQYAPLFNAIGTTFGSADGSHFNVPDMRGRSPMGAGTGTGNGVSGHGLPTGGTTLSAWAVGAWFGEEKHQLISAELPTAVATTGGVDTSTGSGTSTYATAFGGNGSHNTLHPIMVTNFIIKS